MLSKSELEQIKVGDRIIFSAPTRGGTPTANRIVKGFRKTFDWKFDEAGHYIPNSESLGEPLVRFHGWGDFVVRWYEIREHIPA